MADQFRVDTAAFQRAAQRLKDADMGRALAKSIRDVAQPFGKFVLLTGAARMPRRGGLQERIAGGTVRVQSTTLRAAITLSTRQGYQLGAMDAGFVRHPVFERTVTTRVGALRKKKTGRLWVQQSVPAGAFSDAMNQDAPAIQQKILRDLQTVVDGIASN